ncbi:MAG: DNA repair exonuclease [Burkholderiaceae bacterium]
MKFLHAADLHIDSPMRGLDTYDGAPLERLRGATRRALEALVDLALREAVDLVVLAGDVYDRDLGDFRAALFFREQMVRLVRAGVRVFVVKGNHDAEGQISRRLPDVDGVHVFSARTAETVDLEPLGVAVHGRSFPDRAVPEDLVPSYPEPVPGRFNIGVLHTSLTGREGHDPYAPTSVETLAAKGYDYFALGHVHAREVVREARPRIVFPGNLQGRHVGETGSKGCELVVVEGQRIASAEHVPLDVVRWHDVALDASGIDDVNALAQRFHEDGRAHVAGATDRLHALRVTVRGESALHALEAREPGTLAATLQAATQEFELADLWIESVRLDLRSPLDREAAARRPDAVGEVVRLVDELLADDDALTAWARAHVDRLPALPAELADLDPAKVSAAQWRALLTDAEATVLTRLAVAA